MDTTAKRVLRETRKEYGPTYQRCEEMAVCIDSFEDTKVFWFVDDSYVNISTDCIWSN